MSTQPSIHEAEAFLHSRSDGIHPSEEDFVIRLTRTSDNPDLSGGTKVVCSFESFPGSTVPTVPVKKRMHILNGDQVELTSMDGKYTANVFVPQYVLAQSDDDGQSQGAYNDGWQVSFKKTKSKTDKSNTHTSQNDDSGTSGNNNPDGLNINYYHPTNNEINRMRIIIDSTPSSSSGVVHGNNDDFQDINHEIYGSQNNFEFQGVGTNDSFIECSNVRVKRHTSLLRPTDLGRKPPEKGRPYLCAFIPIRFDFPPDNRSITYQGPMHWSRHENMDPNDATTVQA